MLFFRFPFGQKYYTLQAGQQKSVRFFPFSGEDSLDFYGELKEISFDEIIKTESTTENLSGNSNKTQQENQANYEERIESVIRFIKENNLPKLVISRKIVDEIQPKTPVSLNQTFLNLCKSYPNAFCYIFVENGECWLGAFSELLGKLNKKTNRFETMSLAGTLPVSEAWTDKEIHEQQPVSDYIRSVLNTYSADVKQSETYGHISGNIKHLRTDFSAIIQPEKLDELIAELHPTPAVCGIPKDFCRAAISKFENHEREFYAGYIRIETEDAVQCFVNLRCAKLYKNEIQIFAGGGITADSNPEKEWRETELKSLAVKGNLAFRL